MPKKHDDESALIFSYPKSTPTNDWWTRLRAKSGRHVITGEIQSINSASAEDASWTIGRIKLLSESDSIKFIAKGVGGLLPGRVVQIEGFWDKHPKYGTQFLIESCASSELPRERAALVRYLTANVAGLGRELRARMGAAVIVYDNGSVQFFLNDSPRPLFTSYNTNPQS